MTKAELYESISEIRGYFNIGWNDYPINCISCCKSTYGIEVNIVPFRTKGLRGMAVIGDRNQNDLILLNEHRSNNELNFDCGHELMHLCFHRKRKKSFNCFQKVLPQQNKYIEWQANEGSAEFLIPYKLFLPLVKQYYDTFYSWQNIMHFRAIAAEMFNVSESVINYRLENLKYELDQYLAGVPLEKVNILSSSQQLIRNIHVQSIVEKEIELLDIDFSNWKVVGL